MQTYIRNVKHFIAEITVFGKISWLHEFQIQQPNNTDFENEKNRAKFAIPNVFD